jgi:hypothetical protein
MIWQELLPAATTCSNPFMTWPSTLDESDLLLIRHFTEHTSRTIAASEETRQMWRIIVPQLASQHEFVMHALLACAALHMAHLYPERRSELTIKAGTRQNHAMPLFRALPSVESDTCDAAIIFARLVAIAAFAFDEGVFMAEETEDKLPGWLFFIRSGCELSGPEGFFLLCMILQ